MSSTATKGLALVGLHAISVICYFIIFPMAAWNHNVFMLAVSIIIPFVLVQMMKASKHFIYTPKPKRGSTLNSVAAVAIIGILLWNHFWFLMILFLIVLAIRNAKLNKRKRY